MTQIFDENGVVVPNSNRGRTIKSYTDKNCKMMGIMQFK